MRSGLRIIALAAVLVLAGCGVPGGLDGSGALGADGETTPTLTPVAVPQATDTDRGAGVTTAQAKGSDRLAPGLTADGVTDATALAAAHVDALDGVPFTVRQNVTERTADGSLLLSTTTRAAVGPDRQRYRFARTSTEILDGERRVLRTVRFADGEVVHERIILRGGTDQQILRDRTENLSSLPAGLPTRLRDQTGVARIFDGVETTVAGQTERNGTVVYRVESTGIADPESTDLRNASLVAFVTERGLVQEYRLSYVTERVGVGPVHVFSTARFTDVGTTEIRRPSWVTDDSAPSGT